MTPRSWRIWTIIALWRVLRIGAEPKDGVPMGERLDASGQVWVKSAAGEWTQRKRKLLPKWITGSSTRKER